MPPLARYWLVYVLILLAIAVLAVLGFYVFLLADDLARAPHVPLIYGGVWVGVLSLIGSAWSQWKTATIQHAMTSLQALRTDKEYLINSGIVTARVASGAPLSDEEVTAVLADRLQPYRVSDPNFGQAALFVLNQYEFIAAAAMAGSMDKHLLEQTIRGVVIRIVTVFQPLIVQIRRESPAAFTNLVRLYRHFTRKGAGPALDLGPAAPSRPGK
jgi:hypothetical protein